MSTLKELIEGRELPVKIYNKKNAFASYTKVVHVEEGVAFCFYDDLQPTSLSLESDNWELYEEPKKKVKVALYAYRDCCGSYTTTTYMYKDDEHFKHSNPSYKIIKRLDFSEIEVDYE